MLKRFIGLSEIKTDIKIVFVVFMFAAFICAGLSFRTRGTEIRDLSERTQEAVETKNENIVDLPNGSLGVLNINTASASELTTLKGIGRAKAAAIIELRDEIGAFKSVDDLVCVSGIGEAMLSNIREFIIAE